MAFSSTTALALAKISELAYLPKDELPEKVKDLKIRNSRILSNEKSIVFLSRETNKSDTECYLFLTGRKDIIVAFRGSEDFNEEGGYKDWIKTDLDITTVKYPLDDGDPGFFGKHEQFVHHGFWEAYKTIRTKLLKETLSFYNSGYGRKRNLYITGHSLGGALAIHAARELSQIFDLPVKAYTFGSPRIGNNDFAKIFNTSVSESYLFAQKHDPVPFLPPVLPLHIHITNRHYQHPENIKYINKKYEIESKLPSIEPMPPDFNDHSISSYIKSIEKTFSDSS